MSSHHFVREGQEPAVYVFGNEYSEDTLGTLLEWSPKVISTLSAADKLLSLQIKIDQILAPFSQETDKNFLTSLYPLEWTETEDSLQFLFDEIAKFSAPFYLVGLKDEEMSEVFSNASDFIKKQMIGITMDAKWICPSSEWKKWFSTGQSFQLTGNADEWTLKGEIANSHPIYLSLKDQMITFRNTNHHCLKEHLSK